MPSPAAQTRACCGCSEEGAGKVALGGGAAAALPGEVAVGGRAQLLLLLLSHRLLRAPAHAHVISAAALQHRRDCRLLLVCVCQSASFLRDVGSRSLSGV